MTFPPSVAEELLVRCHRHCCLCHKPAGHKMEIHHIVPKSDGGDDSLENGIPLCFDCHAEVETYNPKHPRGRRLTAPELRRHRDQWFAITSKPDWSRPGLVESALDARRRAAEKQRLVRRQVRRVYSEVDASRKTVNDALDTGHFWNVGVTGLQFREWKAARDLLADELPTIHDKVATAYVLVESMNAVANSHRRAARFDERTAEQLKRLRAKLREAQDALRASLEEQEGR